jgi:hypothetical protein
VVVVKRPVGINVICPPPNEIGLGGVIVAIAVVPDINTILLTGAMVVADAIVGAAADVAVIPLTTKLDATEPTTVVPIPKDPAM